MKKISRILSVYNLEEYIKKCLDGFVIQTLITILGTKIKIDPKRGLV